MKNRKLKLILLVALALLVGFSTYVYFTAQNESRHALEAMPETFPEIPETPDIASIENAAQEQVLPTEVIRAADLPNEADMAAAINEAAQLDIASAKEALAKAKASGDAVLIAKTQTQLNKAQAALTAIETAP